MKDIDKGIAIGMLMGKKGKLGEKTITENGEYDPKDEDPPLDGYKKVTVNVGTAELVQKTVNITENGTYTYSPADDNADGYSGVTVGVEVDDGSAEIARLRRQIADLQDQIAQKDATIAEQQEEIDHCRECQAGVKAAIEAIIGSD